MSEQPDYQAAVTDAGASTGAYGQGPEGADYQAAVDAATKD